MEQDREDIASEIAVSGFGAPTTRSIVDFFPAPLFAGGSTSSKALHQGGIKTDALPHGDETTQDNVNTNQSLSAESQLGNLSSRIMEMQLQASPEQCVAAVENINGENIVRMEQDDAIDLRKKGKKSTSETCYGISREDLEKHAGKRLKDVAKIFGISPTTLKQVCRRHSIFRWPVRRGITRLPVSKVKRFMSSFNSQEVGLDRQFSLGIQDGDRSYSVLQSNSPSSIQEMSLGNDLRLGPGIGVQNCIMVESFSSVSAADRSMNIHLGFGPSLELENDSTSSCSGENYPIIK